MKKEINFSVDGSYITDLLRQLWVELECEKIDKIRESIPGLSEILIRGILVGTNKFVSDVSTNEMMYVEDDVKEFVGIDLSVENIRKRFDKTIYDCYDKILGCQKCQNQISYNYDEDGWMYYTDLIESCYDTISKIESNFKSFLVLCNEYPRMNEYEFTTLNCSGIKRKVVKDQKEEEKKETYEGAQYNYAKSLDFSQKNAYQKLVMKPETFSLAQLCALDKCNGLNYLSSHKMAQKEVEDLRPYIYPEKILRTCWNSGWLAPNGNFYGCSDLSHIEFTNHLVDEVDLGLSKIPNAVNNDSLLEKNGFIKFSSGRWLYDTISTNGNDEPLVKPTKEQLSVILEWAKVRSDGKIVFGTTIEEMINIDLLESKMNSAKNYIPKK